MADSPVLEERSAARILPIQSVSSSGIEVTVRRQIASIPTLVEAEDAALCRCRTYHRFKGGH